MGDGKFAGNHRPARPRLAGRTWTGLLACILLGAAACQRSPTPVEPLRGVADLAIDGRGQVELPLAVPAGAPVRLTGVSHDVDVRLVLLDATGQPLATADAPHRRMGIETLLIEAPEADSTVTVRVEGVDHRGARGLVTLSADRLPLESTADQRRLDATRLESAACMIYPMLEHGAQSADAFQDAAELHVRNGDERAAALARLHAAGVRYERLADWPGAADLADRAATALERVDEPLRAAFARRVEGAALGAAAARAADPAERQRFVVRARERLSAAAERLAALGQPYEAAYAYNYRGVSHHEAGQRDRAADDYSQALLLFTAARDAPGQALARQSRALLAYEDGRLAEALEEFDASLRLIPRDEDPVNYAHTLHNSALPLSVLGRFDEAIARYYEAALLLRERGDRSGEARALHGIGTTLRHAGEPERARELLQTAIRLRADVGATREQAVSLTVLGQVELDLGRAEAAIVLHREAAALVTAPRDRARALLALADALTVAGRLDDARAVLEQVLAFDLPPGHRHLGNAWAQLGEVESRAGEPAAARAAFARAVATHRANGSELELARALARRGHAHRRAGHTDGVLADTTAALDLFDRVGLLGTQGESRAVFLAVQRDVAELRIAALLDDAAAARRQGRDDDAATRVREALATSDRVRARLLDDRPPGAAAGGADSALRAELYEQLAGKRARRDQVLNAAEPDAGELARIAADLELLRVQLAALDGGTAGAPQATAAAPEQGLPTVAPGELLLEYFLGEARGWLFALRDTQVTVHEIPPRTTLDRLVRELHATWRQPPDGRRSARPVPLAEIGRNVFGPLAPMPGLRELRIVPDGALHLLPLAEVARQTLPWLGAAPVTITPSLRARAADASGTVPARRLLAVIADPVFSTADPRLHGLTPAAATTPPPASLPLTRGGQSRLALQRLPGAAAEAREIVRLAGERADSLVLAGFDASRARLAEAGLGDFRLLHFATHAWADSEDPALASLALSAYDADGRPVDGVLRLHDITGLALQADLVVLSACETGLGREIAGEGPVSLSQAFLRAGARAVLATLWPVPDSSTAALMREFYRQLLEAKRDPATALRLAQAEVRAIERWSDPYYWAGFQLVAISGSAANGGSQSR